MTQQITYENWSDFLYRAGAIAGPAEVHGFVCGGLSAGAASSEEDRLPMAFEYMDILEPHEDGDGQIHTAVSALYDLTRNQLDDEQLTLQLLLPDDRLSLSVRTQALAAWCQGYLHGLAGAGEDLEARLDEDNREALKDLAAIASLDTEAEASEENEVHFMELVEYVRMASLAIHLQLNPKTDSKAVLH